MMPEVNDYLSPRSLADAARALADGDVTVFCGGTDLTVQTQSGMRQYAGTLMNIRRIEGLGDIQLADGEIRIGTLATVTDIMGDPLIQKAAPILVQACDRFASDQLRNAASLGGNICNASPAGDMIIPLLVLDASVELAHWDGNAVQTRRVSLKEFFVAPGKTVKRDSELLTTIVFDRPADGFRARFRKSGPRPALEISAVSVGLGGIYANGSFDDVRVALGSVAPTPLRAHRIEEALSGRPIDENSIEDAVAAAFEHATPIDDVRASAWYRSHLLRVFIEEVLTDVLESRD